MTASTYNERFKNTWEINPEKAVLQYKKKQQNLQKLQTNKKKKECTYKQWLVR